MVVYWFPLSLRLVEEMLFERSIIVSYETIRRWGIKFGPDYARRLQRKQPSFPSQLGGNCIGWQIILADQQASMFTRAAPTTPS
jgi:hypothetical protein